MPPTNVPGDFDVKFFCVRFKVEVHENLGALGKRLEPL